MQIFPYWGSRDSLFFLCHWCANEFTECSAGVSPRACEVFLAPCGTDAQLRWRLLDDNLLIKNSKQQPCKEQRPQCSYAGGMRALVPYCQACRLPWMDPSPTRPPVVSKHVVINR